MIQLERHERILEHLNTHRFIGAEQALALSAAYGLTSLVGSLPGALVPLVPR